MKVPFLDLNLHHAPIRDEVLAAMAEVVDRNAFAGGPFVEAFEKEFAAYCETAEAVGVGSGTDALWLALLALGVKAGDEVITVPNTFIATAEAISFTGARPVFVDVDPDTYLMDPAGLAEAITPATRAIIPVHLYGQTADMDPILAIAEEAGIPVIEDAAQAHGAYYKDRRAGSIGVAGCFSFYPGKNLGAFGEAGAITTNDPDLARKMRILRDHGQPTKYIHDVVGWNGRMDGIQGAILQVKLRRLDEVNAARRRWAQRYTEALRHIDGVVPPVEDPACQHVYHVYCIRVRQREAFRARLEERGVATAIHYPVPLHLQGAYDKLCYRAGSFPVAEAHAPHLVSLPMFPELTEAQVDYVIEQVAEFAAQTAAVTA